MKNKFMISTTLVSLLLLNACSEASNFDAAVKQKSIKTQDAQPVEGDNAVPAPAVAPAAPLVEEKQDSLILSSGEEHYASISSIVVQVPSKDVRAGSKTIQAVATIAGTSETELVWSVKGPADVDVSLIGSIDAKGLYTSPADDASAFTVTITAALAKDPTVSGSVDIQLVAADQIFVGCKVGNALFPIRGEIFDKLSPSIVKLPDFSKMTSSEIVCMDRFNIPDQEWTAGFPAKPDRIEWFGLRAEANLIAPQTGVYQFRVTSDDGATFYVDKTAQTDAPIVNNDGKHGMTSAQNLKFSMTAGKHKIRLDWYQGQRVRLGLILQWKTPAMVAAGADWEIIPASAFATFVSAPTP